MGSILSHWKGCWHVFSHLTRQWDKNANKANRKSISLVCCYSDASVGALLLCDAPSWVENGIIRVMAFFISCAKVINENAKNVSKNKLDKPRNIERSRNNLYTDERYKKALGPLCWTNHYKDRRSRTSPHNWPTKAKRRGQRKAGRSFCTDL